MSRFALIMPARSSSVKHDHPSTLSASSISHFSSSSSIFFVFFGGGGGGRVGGGVRLLACRGAILERAAFDDFARGLCAGAGEPRGELTLELARLMRSDMEPLRGTMYGVDVRGLAGGRGFGAALGVGGGISEARTSVILLFSYTSGQRVLYKLLSTTYLVRVVLGLLRWHLSNTTGCRFCR